MEPSWVQNGATWGQRSPLERLVQELLLFRPKSHKHTHQKQGSGSGGPRTSAFKLLN